MQAHPDLHLHNIDWRHDLVAAITIVALPALIFFTQIESALQETAFMFAVVVMIVMSFLAGYWIAPRDLWLTFGVACLMTWASFAIADRVGAMGEGEPYDIPPWFAAALILVPMIVVALVPLWTGRLLKRDNMRIAARRKALTEPQ